MSGTHKHCCSPCLGGSPVPSSSHEDPLTAIQNFLPAGSLSFTVQDPQAPFPQCCTEHKHSDGWHIYPGYDLLTTTISLELGARDETTFKVLDFLQEHHFLVATCHLALVESWTLFIRVYFIPHDLSGVKGSLRIRPEASVLSPARKYLRILLPLLSRDICAWKAEYDNGYLGVARPLLDRGKDEQSLAEIYNTLASPAPVLNAHYSSKKDRELVSGILDGHEELEGMRSTLYLYQRRSVAAMLQKELLNSSIPDPLYIPMYGMCGQVFHFQPATMEVFAITPKVWQSRGGILCEEMGTGKTVMVLSLILSTIDQLPQPEEGVLDYRPVMTPISYTTFPFPPHSTALERTTQPRRPVQLGRSSRAGESPKIPSLRQMLLHYFRIRPDVADLRQNQELFESLHIYKSLRNNVPFYFHNNIEPLTTHKPSRRQRDQRPKIMYLSTATLVVVPVNLLHQWESEIHKHCLDEALNVYVAKDANTLPPATHLASRFDLILMSHTRFASEAERDDIQSLHNWKPCKCPLVPGEQIPVPNCCCQQYKSVSPLLQIRWKRIVIDEGHVSAKHTTNLTTLAKSLSVERRWIVSGTPTTNLMGLNFGEGTQLMYPEPELGSPNGDIDLSDTSRSMSTSERGDSEAPIRAWTAQDREDLTKLGSMMQHFLRMPQFSAEQRYFSSLVIAPLMDSDGPLPGAVQALSQVMESVMIRHRIEDVESDILLPFLDHKTVLLNLGNLETQTYNVLQAIIAINAVDSERTDQDYLFHPNNAAHLHQVIENMSQAMFWHTDDNLLNVDEVVEHAQELLQRAASKDTVPQSDQELLKNALQYVQSASQDPLWRALLQHPNAFHDTTHMPRAIFRAWSNLSVPHSTWKPSLTFPPLPERRICSPERLLKLKNMLLQRPLSQTDRIMEWGKAVQYEEVARHDANLGRLLSSKSVKKMHKKERDKIQKTLLLKEMGSDKQQTKERLQAMHEAQVLADKRLRELMDDDNAGPSHPRPQFGTNTPTASSLLARSPLAQVRIGNSTSTKLNYILNDILTDDTSAKFLIFSKSPLTLAYIYESLEIVGVKSLQFTSRVTLKEREQAVITFETSDTYKVFLMELKHGARGLNLISASRVIFCEPVWQADVETQAIKRVHRIGQTLPVTVKTLAIANTYEEVMMTRREELRSNLNSGRKIPSLVDDLTMRHYIANPEFLPESPPSDIKIDVPFLGKFAQPDLTLSSTNPTSNSTSNSNPNSSHKKKRKRHETDVEHGHTCRRDGPQPPAQGSQATQTQVPTHTLPRVRLLVPGSSPTRPKPQARLQASKDAVMSTGNGTVKVDGFRVDVSRSKGGGSGPSSVNTTTIADNTSAGSSSRFGFAHRLQPMVILGAIKGGPRVMKKPRIRFEDDS